MEEFRTSDVDIAAALFVARLWLLRCECDGSDRNVFIFDNSDRRAAGLCKRFERRFRPYASARRRLVRLTRIAKASPCGSADLRGLALAHPPPRVEA